MEGTLEELRRISNCPEGATFSQLGLRKSVGCSPSFVINDAQGYGCLSFTSSSGAAHGKGLIFISEASSTRGPIPLGQKCAKRVRSYKVLWILCSISSRFSESVSVS